MKYLRLFESANWRKNIPIKIKEFSYLIEDESLSITNPHFNEFGSSRYVTMNIWSESNNSLLNRAFQEAIRVSNSRKINPDRRQGVINRISNPYKDAIIEYIKRISDILKNEGVNNLRISFCAYLLYTVDLKEGIIYCRKKIIDEI